MKEYVYVVTKEYFQDERVSAVFKDIFNARRFVAEEYKRMGEFPFEMSIESFELSDSIDHDFAEKVEKDEHYDPKKKNPEKGVLVALSDGRIIYGDYAGKAEYGGKVADIYSEICNYVFATVARDAGTKSFLRNYKNSEEEK